VWWAYCIELAEDVAIKVIDLENVTTNLDEIRVRLTIHTPRAPPLVGWGIRTGFADELSLQNEIRVMSLCNHENVVKYYCSFIHDGHYLWLVMPLMHGGSIQNIMRSYGSLEEAVIMVVLHSILKGIDYFHANDHIHRYKTNLHKLIPRRAW